MFSRWRVPLAAITLMSGSLLVLAAGTASAATASQPGTTHVRPGGAVTGFQPGGPLKNHTGASPQGKGAGNDAESTNWSGYAVTGGTDAFNSVSASWTEPTATCDDSGTEYSSFWVGLDGYNSSSVEQTGTDADCDSGSPDYYGWYEMYPADPVYFTNTVQPGDSMSASVSVSGSTYTITP
jgi:hypothetical protein